MKLSVFWSNNTLPLNGLRGGFKMDDEKKVFSFSSEELREAEELNARADTRMTEEYKQFLEEHFGGEGELYHEHIDESNEYVDRSAADNEGEFCDEHIDESNDYVNQSAADNGGEFCEEYTDANESGEYSEDGLTRSFDDGYVSNRYEPSTSGTFVMDGGSEED
jgi:hypothetical protein